MKRGLVTVGVALAIVLAFTPAARAETESFSYPLSPIPAGEKLTFDQFDDSGGLTLETVTLYLDVTSRFDCTAENTSTIGGDVSVSHLVNVEVSGYGLSASTCTTSTSVTHWLDPAIPPAPDGAGGDFYDFPLIQATDDDDDVLATVLGDDLSAFVGPGQLDFDITGDGWFKFEGVTTCHLDVTVFDVSGTATITYTYIPEPASLSLLVIGGLLLNRRRR